MTDKPLYQKAIEDILKTYDVDYIYAESAAKLILQSLLDSKSFLQLVQKPLDSEIRTPAKVWSYFSNQADSDVINDR